MMSMPSSRRELIPVASWVRWTAVFLIPFSVILFDTWLNTQQINRDYRVADLNVKERQLQQTLNELKVTEARLEKLDRIEIEAPDFGLRPPEPNQIRTIYYTQNGVVSSSGNDTAPLACLREGAPLPQEVAPATPVSESGTKKGEESSCVSVPASHPTSLVEMIVRLRQTIGAAYATYFGHS